MPKEVTEDVVGKVYQEAWESGCKGVTVYRDGSREGVLLTGKEKKMPRAEAIKRPKLLDADLLRFKNEKEDWIAFVGMLEGHPYEIFTGKVEEDVLLIPKSIKKGTILKIRTQDGTSRYDFQYTDKYGNPCTVGGLSYMFDKEFWNYAKLISGILRHGMPLPYAVNLIDSLSLDNEYINSWKAGVTRALKKYISDGTCAPKGETCSECGDDALIYQEGCLICTKCGHSKCG